jgi:hypothetical protein
MFHIVAAISLVGAFIIGSLLAIAVEERDELRKQLKGGRTA